MADKQKIIICIFYFHKIFEDDGSFTYKKVNEDEKTVNFKCINEPCCLATAIFNKETDQLRFDNNHPNENMRTLWRFENFLKEEVAKEENAQFSVLNIYKEAVENSFPDIWLPVKHRTQFLAYLRLERDKPDKSMKVKHVKSPTTGCSPTQVKKLLLDIVNSNKMSLHPNDTTSHVTRIMANLSFDVVSSNSVCEWVQNASISSLDIAPIKEPTLGASDVVSSSSTSTNDSGQQSELSFSN